MVARSPGSGPLPAGWAWVRLGDVADVVSGNSPPGRSYNRSGRGVPLINGPTEFGPGQLDNPIMLQYTDAPTRMCEHGDMLLCVRGSTTGRTNVASFSACIGRGVAAIRAGECQQYINHFVATRADHFIAIGTGSTFPSISADQIRDLAVPLPPLQEQHRIVTALAGAIGELEEGTAALERASADLQRLRMGAFGAALRGQLPGIPPYKRSEESGLDLLARIRTQRRSARDGHDLFEHERSEPGSNGVRDGVELPAGWGSSSFGQVSEVRLGRTRNPSNRPTKNAVPYVRAANITESGLDLTDVLRMDFSPAERETYRLRKGDLLVGEASGSASQVGKAVQWNDELAVCCFQNTVIRLRPVLVESDYLLIALKHNYFAGVFAERAAGVGINHIGAHRLAVIEVPIPPLRQQKAIAVAVATQLSDIDKSQSAINESMTSARALRSSLVDKAFGGGLVEPAHYAESVGQLLARVARNRMKQKQEGTEKVARKKPNVRAARARRTLVDVLAENPDGITPEELFASAGFASEEVDAFYADLGQVTGLKQTLPAG
ncbi:MAG: restriction endonuclease subunit S, partial [Fimbriimonadaceae bacterium]